VLGSGGIVPRILDLGARWRYVVSLTHWPLYPQGKSPWCPLGRRLGGPQGRSGRGGEEQNSQPLPGLEPPTIQAVAQRYTAELSRLLATRISRAYPVYTSCGYCLTIINILNLITLLTRVKGAEVAQWYSAWLRAWRPGFDCRQSLRTFLFATASKPGPGSTQPPIQWLSRVLSPGGKRPGRETDHSPSSRAERSRMRGAIPQLPDTSS
jgi:hypothetical protein